MTDQPLPLKILVDPTMKEGEWKLMTEPLPLNPSIDELEKFLNTDDRREIRINPDGSVEVLNEHGECDKRLAEKEAEIERAKTYKGIEGYACPLCNYGDGIFKGFCSMHAKIQEQAETIKELFESGNEIEDILEVPELLGVSSKIVVQKAIDRFRKALDRVRGK